MKSSFFIKKDLGSPTNRETIVVRDITFGMPKGRFDFPAIAFPAIENVIFVRPILCKALIRDNASILNF